MKYLILVAMLSLLACSDETVDEVNNPDGMSNNQTANSNNASNTNNSNNTASNNTNNTTQTNQTNQTSGTNNPTNNVETPCAPLEIPADAVRVGPSDDWVQAIADAESGETVVLEPGTYPVDSSGVWVRNSGVTVVGAGDAPDDVILDGNYQQSSGGLFNIRGVQNVVLSNFTIRRSRYHAVHVTGSDAGPADGALLHRLRVFDPGEQAIKVNANGNEADFGELACSHVELTADGREQVMSYAPAGLRCYTGGIDIHRSQGWEIRDNLITGFWCSNEFLSEHAIHVWRGARDTLVERNTLINNARGIGFGLGQPGPGRTYDDNPCGAAAEHYGGLIRNNVIIGDDAALFASPSGMDLGIGLESSCEVDVAHNTVASSQAPFSSIEWRFAMTSARVVNNLVTHNLRPRNDATAELLGNAENVGLESFQDFANHDLRLNDSNLTGVGHELGAELAPTDFDGNPRSDSPNIGAF